MARLSVTDVDLGEASISSATAQFGVVTVTEDGGWVYDLDDTNSVVLALDENAAETLIDTITFTSIDGSEVSLRRHDFYGESASGPHAHAR